MNLNRPLSSRQNDRNQAATLWVGGGLDESVDEELVWELFSQVGPVVDVCMPKDKVTGQHQKYAFVEMRSELDAEYAMKVLNMIKLNGKSIRINRSSREQQDFDIGANLFVGNLDRDVDDQILYNTFSAFGQVLDVKAIADMDGTPRGFGFVNFASFEAADAALESMNGQYLCNLPMHVSYAYKKDGAHGERHGTAAERALAANRSAGIVSQSTQVHTQFSAGVEPDARGAPAPAMQQHLQPQLAPGYGYAAQPPPLPPSFSHVPAPAMMQMPPPPVFTAPPPPPPAGFAMAGAMPPPPPQFPPPPPPQAQAYEQSGIQPPPPPPPPGLQQQPPPPPPVSH